MKNIDKLRYNKQQVEEFIKPYKKSDKKGDAIINYGYEDYYGYKKYKKYIDEKQTASERTKSFVENLIKTANYIFLDKLHSSIKELLKQPNVPGRYEFEQNKQKLRRKLFAIFYKRIKKNKNTINIEIEDYKEIVKLIEKELEKYYYHFHEGVYTGKTMPEEEVKNGLNTLEKQISSIGKKNIQIPKTIKKAEKSFDFNDVLKLAKDEDDEDIKMINERINRMNEQSREKERKQRKIELYENKYKSGLELSIIYEQNEDLYNSVNSKHNNSIVKYKKEREYRKKFSKK